MDNTRTWWGCQASWKGENPTKGVSVTSDTQRMGPDPGGPD